MATRYVEIVLALDRHKDAYVDYYVGPPRLLEVSLEGNPVDLVVLHQRALTLLEELSNARESARTRFLTAQTRSVVANIRILRGEKLNFDEWALEMYGYKVTQDAEQKFEEATSALGRALPGNAPVGDRIRAYRSRFYLGPKELRRVAGHCLELGQRRTRDLRTLPEGERATIEYVNGKPWSAYNWYMGNNQSRVEVNVDIPVTAAELCATLLHEAYPGHHVYSTLLDQLAQNGVIELAVYPLASPLSFMFEGTANAGIDVLFPGEKWYEFVRDELAPLAGVPPQERERYALVERAVLTQINHVGIVLAYRFFKERRPQKEIEQTLLDSGAPPQIVEVVAGKFIPAHGPQLGCYSMGMDRVLEFIGVGPGRESRYFELLAKQLTPSDLEPSR
ncbi:MAG: hypothetical protein MJE77_11740 [Proteobacteria bacterium]|nr:hypothetical protein [Pseudomonadota bacterium]